MKKTLEAASEFSNQSFLFVLSQIWLRALVESAKEAVKDRQKRGTAPRKIRYDSYMQWALCLMVTLVSVVMGFYPLERRI